MHPESCPSCGFRLAAARTSEACPACGRSLRGGILRRLLGSLFSSGHNVGPFGGTRVALPQARPVQSAPRLHARVPEPPPPAAARPVPKEANPGPGVTYRGSIQTTHKVTSLEEFAPVLRAVVTGLMAGGGMRGLLRALLGPWSAPRTGPGGGITVRSAEPRHELPAGVRTRIDTLVAGTAGPTASPATPPGDVAHREAQDELPAEIRAILDRIRKS